MKGVHIRNPSQANVRFWVEKINLEHDEFAMVAKIMFL